MVVLTWDGKYDRDGRKVAPVRVALPFQDIETVNESAQQCRLTLDRLRVRHRALLEAPGPASASRSSTPTAT